MKLLALFSLGILGASASTVDPSTGIAFETFTSPQGYAFGIAVPESPTTDFIGQLVIPSTGSGYGGIALGGQMLSDLLIVAWPNGKNVVASFRYTSQRASPGVYTSSAPLSMTPIAKGTFVNTTHMSYTFVCAGCITNNALTFASNASAIQLGWSLSDSLVTNPSSPSQASFMFHSVGYGTYSLSLDEARSAKFASWAAVASAASASNVVSTATSMASSASETFGGTSSPSITSATQTKTSSSASATGTGKTSGSSRLEWPYWWVELGLLIGPFFLGLY